MNSPLISIIVPVYQVEIYLEKCINSIITQTYKNLEIILVDDGSSDNCPTICNRFQAEDSRIKVVHQENGGLSHARNVGLEMATGEFIGFVDSDDWIEINMYEVLLSVLQETDADIAVCNFISETDNSKIIPTKTNTYKKNLYSNEEALKRLLSGKSFIYAYVWNKLFRKNILLNISFQEGKIYEDILWTPQVIGNSKLIACIDYQLYHYRHRDKSLSHNGDFTIENLMDKIEMHKQQIEYMHKHYPHLEKISILNFQNCCCSVYIKICLNKIHIDEEEKILHNIHHLFCNSGSINIHKYDGLRMFLGRILFKFSPFLLLKTYIFWQKYSQAFQWLSILLIFI